MHYIKPVRVLSCMFKYIVMCLCLGGNGYGCSRLFFYSLTPDPSPRGEGNFG